MMVSLATPVMAWYAGDVTSRPSLKSRLTPSAPACGSATKSATANRWGAVRGGSCPSSRARGSAFVARRRAWRAPPRRARASTSNPEASGQSPARRRAGWAQRRSLRPLPVRGVLLEQLGRPAQRPRAHAERLDDRGHAAQEGEACASPRRREASGAPGRPARPSCGGRRWTSIRATASSRPR